MDDNPEVDRLLSRWRNLRRQGQALAPEVLCADCPENLPELRRRLEALGATTAAAPTVAAVTADSGHDELQTTPDPRSAQTIGLPPLPPPAMPGAPLQVAGYLVLGELGQGGMGVVYRARHLALERDVALKTVRASHLRSPQMLERFLREARAVARLRHPHIVPLYEIGEMPAGPYFTMALVDGGSLAEHRQRLRGDPRTAVQIVEKVARAVQHAHDNGIVHRDLKPGNILLDRAGEPLVCDFGLAKFTQVGEHTPSGNVLGTIAYLSPEQASGSSSGVGPATDVWSLGVILYELLTGERPFNADTLPMLLGHIQYDDPRQLRAVAPQLDAGLERIVLKCLEKHPADRYGSAGALADDLKRWLDGLTVDAPAVPRRRRLWRAWQRRPVLGTALVLGLAAAVVVPVAAELSGTPETQQVREIVRPVETPLEMIQRRLRVGEQVDLLPPRGSPPVFSWALGQKTGTINRSLDGLFALKNDNGFALLELLPAVDADRWRLDARVAQVDGQAACFVGLFVGHQQIPTGSGTHFFMTLGFSETQTLAGSIELSAWVVGDPDQGKFDRKRRALGGYRKFDPQASPRGLRHLAIEYLEDRISLWWEGELYCTLPRSEIEGRQAAWLGRLMLNTVAPKPQFGPRNGLGIVVYNGTASFESVRISPTR